MGSTRPSAIKNGLNINVYGNMSVKQFKTKSTNS